MNNVTFTRIKIFRNVKDYKFTRKLEQEKRDEILQKVTSVLKDKMTVIDNSNDAINNLIKNKLVLNNAIVLSNKNNDVCVNLFGSEHITIIASAFGYNTDIFKKATEISEILNNKINLSFNDEYGYLMSDISLIGAGIKLECDINLNSLKNLGKIEQLKQNLNKLGYNLVKTGNPCIFTLSSNCNLGLTENEIFKDFEKTISKLVELEVESLKLEEANKHDEFLDKIYRSVAVLKSAYLLTPDEMNNLLTNLLAGINLGVISLDSEKLKTLFSLTYNSNAFISQKEAKNLAIQVREILKGV